MLYSILFRRLLPVQTNTDEHDPEFCWDNYNTTLRNGTISVNPRCRVYPEFAGAPPRVIILCITNMLLTMLVPLLCACSDHVVIMVD